VDPEARLHRFVPWNPVAARGVLVWTALSTVALTWCWYRAAGKGVLDDQMLWLTLAVLVVAAELYVLVGVVFSGRRALGLRRMRMLPDTLLQAVWRAPGATDRLRPAVNDQAVLVVVGSSRFHRQGCALSAGRDVRAVAFREADSLGLRPCGICGAVSST
jgi:hypothetical protein